MAHDGSNLFQIRRIFGFSTSTPTSNGSIAALHIASMAVHTLEKKQLLALAICENIAKPVFHSKSESSSTPSASPADAKTTFLLVRTIEEDQRTRFWRIPVCSTPKQQKAGKAERLFALEFSPEGDWLAALSQRKNRLHLVPVLKIVSMQRRAMLDAAYQPTSHHRELMSVNQAAMTTQMASYLRATNEYGGINGARYHSQVAGDNEQMSTLEFAPGIGRITCVRWWRSLNGKNYCLVGGTESLISIVNVEENAEECRCELLNAGSILSIDLLQETFKKERRTSMLVKTKSEEWDENGKEIRESGIKYYRVVLEKKVESVKKSRNQGKNDVVSVLKVVTTTGASSSSSETNFTALTTDGELPSLVSMTKAPTYVVKTFPQHFLEDLDFRPQRIKKNAPHVCLYPINGVLNSESSLALYDCEKKKVYLYSNFHWKLKGEYEVPNLLPASMAHAEEHCKSESSACSCEQKTADSREHHDEVVDVSLTYCSTDLMLLQGRKSKSNETISTWVSLPSNQGMDEDVVRAHLVHYLSLHDNERIERVVQSTAQSRMNPSLGAASTSVSSNQSDEAEIIYILQTKHHVYECRPQWSRLALFKALCSREIVLRDALSIGYALGIDMASLCQVVANTVYASVIDGTTSADDLLFQWVRELFEVSRVVPSKAVEQLTEMGGIQSAINYAQHVLAKPVRDSNHDKLERRRVALMLVNLILQQQLLYTTSNEPFPHTEVEPLHHKPDEKREAWLVEFFKTNRDFVTAEVVDLCLSRHQLEKAILVATLRNEVPETLDKIINKGLASVISEDLVMYLVESGHASALASPHSRLILRSFPIQIQVKILLAYPPAILQHRDWLVRNLAAISQDLCCELARKIDPTQPETTDLSQSATAAYSMSAKRRFTTDIATSEFMQVAPEEQVELFLTLLLHLNHQVHCSGENGRLKVAENGKDYSQARLESLLKDLAAQYRPPIMVSRCVDYENWTAAACIYEAHGELVEALDCRLHSHNSCPSPCVASSASSDTQQPNDSSSSSMPDKSKFQEQMREELLGLLNSLVVQNHSSEVVSEQICAAILARILVKWFDFNLERTVLEDYLLEATVFQHVSSLLAQIFFSKVVHSILSLGPDASSAANGVSPNFDDRDKEWVNKCQQLPFSGQFLFRVCVSFLEKNQDDNMAGYLSNEPPTRKLVEIVKTNVVENDLSHRVVSITPHSAQALGKTDPLETHVKAFTCGHLFPKRVFEEEVVPEFEKRMNALPMALFATKQAFTREFKLRASETPCPVCSFNKISPIVFQHYNKTRHTIHQDQLGEPSMQIPNSHAENEVEELFFLHRNVSERFGGLSSRKIKPLEHETWKWLGHRAL
ncbi:hypothetical protein CCR75_006436 [Bremia lactucae]|uniref:Uncharacterized protein n=1 Tax=Bremia lactucae TaxID=4779 RepID=A0A976FJR4_BRELC|nr:hypothetical protein CCR75_006433 [Bremia lactucae]TDH68062.1 hypothetical protein CCR75_006436 [Bremia lactucae]